MGLGSITTREKSMFVIFSYLGRGLGCVECGGRGRRGWRRVKVAVCGGDGVTGGGPVAGDGV